MARIKKKLLGNLQDKIIQVCSPNLIFFFHSVCQSIATHTFVYFVSAHVCLSVSVDVAFYFKLGFGRDMGLYLDFGDVDWGLHLDFGGRGFESRFCFWGVGSVYLKLSFVWGWGWFYFDFLGDYFFLREFFFVFVLWWNFINICLTFTHSFTQFFFCVLWGGVSVGRCAFLFLGIDV